MPDTNEQRDPVKEAREFIAIVGNCGLYPDTAQRHIKILCDEVDRLRERFSVTCYECGARYLGPKDELTHGYNVCNMTRCED